MNGKSDRSDIPSGSPADWPCSLTELKELDTILRCGICFEYMTTAMMLTKCSHNYCSLCIRRYIIYKQQCPTCIENVLESDLRNNRLLDDVIRIFTSSRTKLLNITKSTAISSDEPVASSSNLKSRSSSESMKKKTSSANESIVPKKSLLAWDDSSDSDATVDDKTITTSPAEKKGKKEITVEKKDNEMPIVNNDVETKTPNPSIGSHRSPIFFPKVCSSSGTLHVVRSPSYSTVTSPASTSTVDAVISPSSASQSIASTLVSPGASSSKKVPCPVCSVQVPETYINIHLDRCLATDSKKEALRSHGTPKRKTMPKLVYNLMKDNDIRKKLNEVGLPTHGDRQKLIKRHQEFTLIYNSQCDSLNPKSTEEIVREMMKSDLKKSEPAAGGPSAQIIKVDKNASSKDIEDAQKQYVKKHKSQFSELMEAAKRSWKSKKLNVDDASRSTAASNDESSLMGDEESTKIGQAGDLKMDNKNKKDIPSALNDKAVSYDEQSKDDHPDRLSTSYQDVDGHMSMSGGHRGKMTQIVASDTIPFVNGTKDEGCPTDEENLFEESSLLNSSSKLLNASINPADNSTMSLTKDKKQKKKNRNSASRRKRLDSLSSVDFDFYSDVVIDTPSKKRTTRPRRSAVKSRNLDESAVVDTDEDDEGVRKDAADRKRELKRRQTSNPKNVKGRKNEKKSVKSTDCDVKPMKSTDCDVKPMKSTDGDVKSIDDVSDVSWTAAGDKIEEREIECPDSDDDLDISLTQNVPKRKLKRKASGGGHAMPAEVSSDVDASVTIKNLKKKRKLAYNEETSERKLVEDATVLKKRGRKPKARDQCSEEAV